jgi:hypothetical protein
MTEYEPTMVMPIGRFKLQRSVDKTVELTKASADAAAAKFQRNRRAPFEARAVRATSGADVAAPAAQFHGEDSAHVGVLVLDRLQAARRLRDAEHRRQG